MAVGARSKLVLAKLGHDLRGAYDEVLSAPLPPSIAMRAHRLPGLHDIIDLGAAPQPWLAAPEANDAAAHSVLVDDGGPIL